ncbi:MAG: hypothetical protein QQN41_09540 [Nitrosopumilus sp.]
MRKIKVVKWQENIIKRDAEGKPILKDGKQQVEQIDTDTISLLDMMLTMKKPESMPRGLDSFRIMNRLVKAFDNARKVGTLELEETDYKFLKDSLESDIPATWGTIPKAYEAIDLFMEAKAEESKSE